MSLLKIPLTERERGGLVAHGLPTDAHSQMTDCFRLGMRWALEGTVSNSAVVAELAPCPTCKHTVKIAEDTDFQRYWVQCTNDSCPKAYLSPSFDYDEAAIAWWSKHSGGEG